MGKHQINKVQCCFNVYRSKKIQAITTIRNANTIWKNSLNEGIFLFKATESIFSLFLFSNNIGKSKVHLMLPKQ